MNTTTLTTASNRVPFFTAYAFKDESENSLTRVSAYFNLSQHATEVEFKGKSLTELNVVSQKDLQQSPFMVALKVISYCTVIIPLIMLIIYAIVRSYYTISSQLPPASAASTPTAPSIYETINSAPDRGSDSSQNNTSSANPQGLVSLASSRPSAHGLSSGLQKIINSTSQVVLKTKGILSSSADFNTFLTSRSSSALAIRTSTPDGASKVSGSTVTSVSLDEQIRNAAKELEHSHKELSALYNKCIEDKKGMQSYLDSSETGWRWTISVGRPATPLRTGMKTA